MTHEYHIPDWTKFPAVATMKKELADLRRQLAEAEKRIHSLEDSAAHFAELRTAAESRLREAEARVEAWRENSDSWQEAATAAESRLAQAMAALEEVVRVDTFWRDGGSGNQYGPCAEIARPALAAFTATAAPASEEG